MSVVFKIPNGFRHVGHSALGKGWTSINVGEWGPADPVDPANIIAITDITGWGGRNYPKDTMSVVVLRTGGVVFSFDYAEAIAKKLQTMGIAIESCTIGDKMVNAAPNNFCLPPVRVFKYRPKQAVMGL